jgi:itaconyl-CoA hydratase
VTPAGTHFEDFAVGDRMRHARGKTVTTFDGAFLAQLVVNTSDGHFNDDVMRDTAVGEAVVFGGLTLAFVIGLTLDDTGANAIAELGLDDVRLKAPVVHGDTLYAATEVIATEPEAGGGGTATFRHWGLNAAGAVVLRCDRRVRIRGRGADA